MGEYWVALNHHRRVQSGQNGGFARANQPAGGVERRRAEDVGHNQYAVVSGNSCSVAMALLMMSVWSSSGSTPRMRMFPVFP